MVKNFNVKNEILLFKESVKKNTILVLLNFFVNLVQYNYERGGFMDFTLSLPEELYKKIKELGREEGRSFNKELNYIIKWYLEEKKKEEENKKEN